MRKNYSRFAHNTDGSLSIWVKLTRYPSHILDLMRSGNTNPHNHIMVMETKGIWIYAIDLMDLDYEITFTSNEVFDLVFDNPGYYFCTVNQIDTTSSDYVAELKIFDEDYKDNMMSLVEDSEVPDNGEKNTYVSPFKKYEVKMPTSTQNLEFVTSQLQRKINGEDSTALIFSMHNDAPGYILGFECSTRMSVCYFESKELEAILKKGKSIWGLFDSTKGSPSNQNIKVTFSALTLGDESADTSVTKSPSAQVIPVKRKSINDLGNQDLKTTSALVYLKYTLSDGEQKRLAIMNGNIRSNVVGSDFIDGYREFESNIKEGDKVKIIPEPNNPKDRDALAVYWNSKKIGYIPRINIPGVALCMEPNGIEAIVYENNLGWVAVYIEPTLVHLGEEYYDNHFGPYSIEVVVDNEPFTMSISEFKKHFYYGGKPKCSSNSKPTKNPKEKGEIYTLDNFNPIHDITLGKFTREEARRAGYNVETTSHGWLNFTEPISKITFWDFGKRGVFDEIYTTYSSLFPKKWTLLGLSWSTSYDEWLDFFHSHGFKVKVTKKPNIQEWMGKKRFVAEFSATSYNKDCEMRLSFNYGNEHNEGCDSSSTNSLYSISFKILL